MAHFGLKTDWMKYGDLCPLPGDIIEFKRGAGVYHHVGIADGDYGIYHFSSEPAAPEFGIMCMKLKSRFRHDKLRLVARGCTMRINNSEDHVKMAATNVVNVSEIIQRCEDHVGKGFGTYDILRNNCQHKATEMRYGTASSEQVQKAKRILHTMSAPAARVVKMTSLRLFYPHGTGMTTSMAPVHSKHDSLPEVKACPDYLPEVKPCTERLSKVKGCPENLTEVKAPMVENQLEMDNRDDIENICLAEEHYNVIE